MTATFQLAQPPAQRRLVLSDPGKPPMSLNDRHRPATLAEMVGQGAAVYRLQEFLEAPYSAAFLFEGPTGVGKTTAALAVAAELGAVEFGGLETIKSGMQDAEAVERVLDSLRFTPMLGSGWKVIIVDEADWMSQKAAQIWLSALEDLPPRSVIIFTTNKTEKFPDRFLDRCERLMFASHGAELMQDAQALADTVWLRETGRTDTPRVAGMPGLLDASGAISFRRVVRALEPMIRAASRRPAPVNAPVAPTAPDFRAMGERWYGGTPMTVMSRETRIPVRVIDREIGKLGYTAKGKAALIPIRQFKPRKAR